MLSISLQRKIKFLLIDQSNQQNKKSIKQLKTKIIVQAQKDLDRQKQPHDLYQSTTATTTKNHMLGIYI